MNAGIHTVIYPVKDLDRAKAIYTALLGVEPYIDQPYYVGYRVGDQEFGLDPHGHDVGATGGVAYYDVDDIRATIDRLVDSGAQQQGDVRDVGGGKLIVTVRDADGNVFGLSQAP